MKAQAKHTPGPLKVDDFGIITGGPHFCTSIADCSLPPKLKNKDDAIKVLQAHHQNGRLLVAAWNSYDKHCGSRAVECAEGDLLGELLEALKNITAMVEINFAHHKLIQVEKARQVIAKCEMIGEDT